MDSATKWRDWFLIVALICAATIGYARWRESNQQASGELIQWKGTGCGIQPDPKNAKFVHLLLAWERGQKPILDPEPDPEPRCW